MHLQISQEMKVYKVVRYNMLNHLILVLYFCKNNYPQMYAMHFGLKKKLFAFTSNAFDIYPDLHWTLFYENKSYRIPIQY